MSSHFFNQLDNLHRDILTMCSTVEDNINEAVNGLLNRSADLDKELNVRDREVNDLDIKIEEECLKVLALYHPVAHDLRRVSTVFKVTGELERVGDLAVNIAERSSAIAQHPEFPLPPRLREMARLSLEMLHDSIDSYVEQDGAKARDVCARDDFVDELNVELLDLLRSDMTSTPEIIEPGMHLFSAIRHIERVADHATNIAEDVVYMIDGEIIRHGGPDAERA